MESTKLILWSQRIYVYGLDFTLWIIVYGLYLFLFIYIYGFVRVYIYVYGVNRVALLSV